eukprot:scaffold46162_cov73-Cyclotella_meneghiniana.AAC.2
MDLWILDFGSLIFESLDILNHGDAFFEVTYIQNSKPHLKQFQQHRRANTVAIMVTGWRGYEIQLVDAINLLEGSKPVKYFRICFFFNHQYPVARIKMCIGAAEYKLEHELRQEELGAAFRRSTNVRQLMVERSGRIDEDNNFDRPVFQSIQALYRGFQSNTSIEKLVVNLDSYPSDASLIAFNLRKVRFKESLKCVTLYSWRAISDNQIDMIESFLESTSLKELIMAGLRFDIDNEEAFQRIVVASFKVEQLKVFCSSLSQYAAVATLLRDSRSILSEVELVGKVEVGGIVISEVDEEGLPIIATGLANNTTHNIGEIESPWL